MNVKSPGVWIVGGALACALGFASASQTAADKLHGTELTFSDNAGVQQTLTATPIDTNNPFFQALGTNGRTCVSCHRPDQGGTIAPAELKGRFDATSGLDPIFSTNDGSNCEGA